MMRYVALMTGLTLAAQAFAWGPATHAYLAERATGSTRPGLHFGSILPDMNNVVFNKPDVFDAMRTLTHYECNLLPSSCLVLGMITHNEAWGADWYSHQHWLNETAEAEALYSTRKIRQIEDEFGLRPDQAEFLFEFAIDYLLRVEDGPGLGRKLLLGAAEFGPGQQQQLIDAFAVPLSQRVAGLSIEQAREELRAAARQYRFAIEVYGTAYLSDETAAFDMLTSLTAFYLCLDAATAADGLWFAVELCRDDYRAELDRIAGLLRADLAVHAPETLQSCAWGCSAPAPGTTNAAVDPVLGAMLALGPLRLAGRRLGRIRRGVNVRSE